MLQSLKLLLPALIPSWRFFNTIAPSPRIEFALPETTQANAQNWQEFCPRPAYLSIPAMIKRIFWNPGWNESLYLVSLAERLVKNPTLHSSNEIVKHIAKGLQAPAAYLQFRLVFISRQGKDLQKHVIFISPIQKLESI